MGKDENAPSDKEWKIMEVLWDSDGALTSSEIIKRLRDSAPMQPKMVRVLMNRLCQKGIVGFEVDSKDARVYHYTPLKTKDECLKEKSRKFVNNYFSGNKQLAAGSAMAALLQSFDLTDEQFADLEMMITQSKDIRKE